MTAFVNASVVEVPYCCGAKVVCDFEDQVGGAQWAADNPTAAWRMCLQECLEEGFTYQFWFVKYTLEDSDDEWEDEFEYQELLDLVKSLPGATMLASYVNPNSDNIIEGWLLDNTKGQITL